MTIYQDGVEQEQVPLHPIQSKPELHALFQKKGFVLKKKEDKKNAEPEAEPKPKGLLAQRREQRKKERELQRQERVYLGQTAFAPRYGTVLGLYGVVAGLLVCMASCARSSRRR